MEHSVKLRQYLSPLDAFGADNLQPGQFRLDEGIYTWDRPIEPHFGSRTFFCQQSIDVSEQSVFAFD